MHQEDKGWGTAGVRLGASRVHVCDIVQFMELTLSESCTKLIVASPSPKRSLSITTQATLNFILNCSTDELTLMVPISHAC